MGSVFKKTVTRPLPPGAELFTKRGEQFARWKPPKGRTKTAKVTTGKDGSLRIVEESATYIAKYRDGSGYICETSTGCRDEDAARSVLGKLERRAELVKSEVISSAEAATADHQQTPLADHFAAYMNHLRSKGTSARHVADTKRLAEQVFNDCECETLRDIHHDTVEGWLAGRLAANMGARTRNSYLQAVRGFCKWCAQSGRLSVNPLARISKADENCDRRRQRRAMTEAELVNLLQVARLRPLAEFGRETLSVDASETEVTGKRRKRSNWTYKPLTLETLHEAVERARKRLAENPDLIAELEQVGRERALIYKTLVLTGLRKGELASITVSQLELVGLMPFIELDAPDEKNRQGSTIPLRTDLANDLKLWISERSNGESIKIRKDAGKSDAKRPLFAVPDALIKILNRDLIAAGIEKKDNRGRTIDVHALRHSFGTLLSKGGVAPRTAQAAMRHSKIDLTMNVYTDPKLLDVQGALDSLPSLNLDNSPAIEQNRMRATGTDHQDSMPDKRHSASAVAPTVAPKVGEQRQNVSLPAPASTDTDVRLAIRTTDEKPHKSKQKALSTVIVNKANFSEVDGARTRNHRIDSPVL